MSFHQTNNTICFLHNLHSDSCSYKLQWGDLGPAVPDVVLPDRVPGQIAAAQLPSHQRVGQLQIACKCIVKSKSVVFAFVARCPARSDRCLVCLTVISSMQTVELPHLRAAASTAKYRGNCACVRRRAGLNGARLAQWRVANNFGKLQGEVCTDKCTFMQLTTPGHLLLSSACTVELCSRSSTEQSCAPHTSLLVEWPMIWCR